jgi:hypothetical protein
MWNTQKIEEGCIYREGVGAKYTDLKRFKSITINFEMQIEIHDLLLKNM